MAGLTNKGFESKSLAEIKADFEAELESVFGTVNKDPESVFGQLIGISSEARARLWQLAEAVYQSQYPGSASGLNLDRVVALNGITRRLASPTTVSAVLLGAIGTTIDAGKQASNAITGDVYTLNKAVTLSTTDVIRFVIEINNVASSTDYDVTVGGSMATYTSDSDATESEIVSGVEAVVSGLSEVDSTEINDGAITVTLTAVASSISVSSDLTISETGNLEGFTAEQSGPRLLPANTLTEIETPVSGWSGVDNLEAGSVGDEEETDAELRARRANSLQAFASNTVEAIFTAVGSVSGVTGVIVKENSGTTTDSDGVPPQHIWVVVEGGDGRDIAEAIFKNTAGGIGYFGSSSEVITSTVNGQDYEVKYQRPTPVEVYIEVDITAENDFPADGAERIKDALVEFGQNLNIGEDLLYSRLYTPINSVPGHYVNDLQVGESSPASGTVNIAAETEKLIVIASTRITVNVT